MNLALSQCRTMQLKCWLSQQIFPRMTLRDIVEVRYEKRNENVSFKKWHLSWRGYSGELRMQKWAWALRQTKTLKTFEFKKNERKKKTAPSVITRWAKKTTTGKETDCVPTHFFLILACQFIKTVDVYVYISIYAIRRHYTPARKYHSSYCPDGAPIASEH